MSEAMYGIAEYAEGLFKYLKQLGWKSPDEQRIAALQAELDAYDADYTLCDCCNCLTPDPIDCGEHVQCKSCTRLAELEAE